MIGGHVYRTQMGDLIVAASVADALAVIGEFRAESNLPRVSVLVRQIPDSEWFGYTRTAGAFAEQMPRGVYTQSDDGGW